MTEPQQTRLALGLLIVAPIVAVAMYVLGRSDARADFERIWLLPQGEVIGCRSARVTACGLTLERCGYEEAQTLECVVGAELLEARP